MEFLDEQLLEMKKQQKKEKFQSLETGFYIKDELIEFERVTIEQFLLTMMLPKTFVTMPQSMIKVKYPSENRPQLIKTSLDTSVNVTFSTVSHKVKPEQLRPLANQVQAVIRKVNPANVFYDLQEGQTELGLPVCWFDYKGYALDEQVYYMITLLPWHNDQLIYWAFNCVYSDREEWAEAARQMVLSIAEMKEGEDV